MVQSIQAFLDNVTLTCPKYAAVMTQFQCQVIITSGTSMIALVNYGSVYTESFYVAGNYLKIKLHGWVKSCIIV